MISFKSDEKNLEFIMSSSVDAYELLEQYISFACKLGLSENSIKDAVSKLGADYEAEFYIDEPNEESECYVCGGVTIDVPSLPGTSCLECGKIKASNEH